MENSLLKCRIKRFQLVSATKYKARQLEDAEEMVNKASNDLTGSLDDKTVRTGSPFLAKLAIVLGIAATVTFLAIGPKQPNQGSNFGIQFLVDGSSSSITSTPAPRFSFKAFVCRVMLPEYAPG
ncbi:putative DNA-directed RNA polymerase subunit beta-like [Capsicum annuum]|nr:putative DNA-directed RNA polymerase subunit beta-like [Capsicum annuum]